VEVREAMKRVAFDHEWNKYVSKLTKAMTKAMACFVRRKVRRDNF